MLDRIEDLLEVVKICYCTTNYLPKRAGAEEMAARYDDVDDLISLASAGVSLDSKDLQGRTALHMASANGHLNIVEYLVRQGVDVNVSNVEQNTPLHWACLNGHIEVVKCLILAGANVSLLNSHQRTPVDEAVSRGNMSVIDAVNEAMAQKELGGATINEAVAQDELLSTES